MTPQSSLDAHIVKKYSGVSTISSSNNASTSTNDPDKLWDSLGAMALMNMATQQISRSAA